MHLLFHRNRHTALQRLLAPREPDSPAPAQHVWNVLVYVCAWVHVHGCMCTDVCVWVLTARQQSLFDRLPDELLVRVFEFLDHLGNCAACGCANACGAQICWPSQTCRGAATGSATTRTTDSRCILHRAGASSHSAQALDLQPHWHQLTDGLLDSIQNRCSALQQLSLSWSGGGEVAPRTATIIMTRLAGAVDHARRAQLCRGCRQLAHVSAAGSWRRSLPRLAHTCTRPAARTSTTSCCALSWTPARCCQVRQHCIAHPAHGVAELDLQFCRGVGHGFACIRQLVCTRQSHGTATALQTQLTRLNLHNTMVNSGAALEIVGFAAASDTLHPPCR